MNNSFAPGRRGSVAPIHLHRISAAFFVFLFLAAFPGWARGGTDAGKATPEALARNYNLPPHFLQLILDRNRIDSYQMRFHRVEAGITPVPTTVFTERNRGGRFVQVMRNQPPEPILKYWQGLPPKIVPPASFCAPILDHSTDRLPVDLKLERLDEAERTAAHRISERLASDGLLATLQEVLQILGPARFLTNGQAGLDQLIRVGYPADLLNYFSISSGEEAKLSSTEKQGAAGKTNRAFRIVGYLAGKLARPGEAAPDLLNAFRFGFVPSQPGFGVATESGETDPGLVRMQAGGGYHNGIIPGDNLDVVCQIVAALPKSDFLISVPLDLLERIEWMATHTWRLRRAGQVTLVGEPLPVGAWAQDDGKAGYVLTEKTGAEAGNRAAVKPATLAPRYASIDEGKSTFEPGESLLMDGVSSSGHAVAHSSLLFQGGNLLPVRDPKSGQRILLVSEGEIFRNMALGLAREQVIEALGLEFGVDRCVVISAVSYHLDFDVSIRALGGEWIAFVNDAPAAARLIVGLGIDTFERNGVLDPKTAQIVREDFDGGRSAQGIRRLRNLLNEQTKGRSELPASFSKFFVSGKMDSAAGNLQSFLLALDLLESAVIGESDLSAMEKERAEYLRALKRSEAARRRQADEIAGLGCKLVPVPSMTDLYRGINYLNGTQHRDGYLMPVFGGFYAALDQVAVAAFRKIMGSDLRISTIYTAECQRVQGGVHCTAAVYGRE